MIFNLILLAIIIATVAVIGTEGAWGSGIMFMNAVTAALIATNFWEPISAALLAWQVGGEYFWDFFVLTGLFAIVLMVLRTITDKLSRKKVIFPKLVDLIGGYFFGAWTGWVLVCFIVVAMQTAPIPRNFIFGGYTPDSRSFFGFGPDRLWLGFVQRMSLGALMPLSAEKPEDPNGPHVFDPRGEFILKYATHRDHYDKSDPNNLSGVVVGP